MYSMKCKVLYFVKYQNIEFNVFAHANMIKKTGTTVVDTNKKSGYV